MTWNRVGLALCSLGLLPWLWAAFYVIARFCGA